MLAAAGLTGAGGCWVTGALYVAALDGSGTEYCCGAVEVSHYLLTVLIGTLWIVQLRFCLLKKALV